MFATLKQVVGENWHWRRQVWNLAKIDLVKTYRGAALGKIWLFAKPAVYILVFWVALKFGLRSSSDVNGKPFLLWLAAGVFPWFFMSDMITTGSDVYRRYPYLVNRIKFPLSLISTFYTLSLLIIFACMMAFTTVVALLTGVHLGRYMLQLPLVMVFMFIFWLAWSMALSPLSAISRDFSNLLKTLGTPFFWLSGILFDISGWPRTARLVASFNPVTWVVQSVRDCFIYNKWFFTDWESFLPFLFVLLIFVVLALHNYHRLYMEVPEDASNPVAVRFDHVTKQYKLFKNDKLRLLSTFSKRIPHDTVNASDDLSFTVNRGESLALLGDNGAGKSTALKMITGVCFPTSGTVEVHGRVSALLELSAGFDMKLSGMENIDMRCQLWGLSKEESKELIPEIVEFSELGKYIDQPMRTYSSGMRARLGFAFVSSIRPDILVVDEALSVGDRKFAKKCRERVNSIIANENVTVLFVTHSTGTAKEFCHRGIVIQKGKAMFSGGIEEAVDFYTAS